jgi:CO/xanthine dehydrogenase Mo-binding subunit
MASNKTSSKTEAPADKAKSRGGQHGGNGAPAAPAQFKVIGTRPIRHDGADKVTGRAVYANDVHLTGMVHGRVLRSPHAHARIKSIDASAAERLAGVVAVITGADLPDHKDKIANLGEGAVNLADLANKLLQEGALQRARRRRRRRHQSARRRRGTQTHQGRL